MAKVQHWVAIAGLGLGLALLPSMVQAIPGQSIDEATAWIQSNPTLQPSRGEKLLVRKTATPAQRFTFQALPLQAGRAAPGTGGRAAIRTEELAMFDMINGLTIFRLEESLRAIYGASIYQDYAQASVVFAYPDLSIRGQATNRATPLLAQLQGELREGDRFAYWTEITRRADGYAYMGRLTVFLKEDLPKLEAELRSR
ncbi:hypothetical protein [Pantanalinema sp. GBBB05]|uniref:hypothetical protein n=1 Tax=Pantanalinema sp. GBBB05 TaxID=2604139 RepID=UPI003D817A66